jgi:hypothetical protein
VLPISDPKILNEIFEREGDEDDGEYDTFDQYSRNANGRRRKLKQYAVVPCRISNADICVEILLQLILKNSEIPLHLSNGGPPGNASSQYYLHYLWKNESMRKI